MHNILVSDKSLVLPLYFDGIPTRKGTAGNNPEAIFYVQLLKKREYNFSNLTLKKIK